MIDLSFAFVIGAMFGAFVGMVVTSLMVISSDVERREEFKEDYHDED